MPERVDRAVGWVLGRSRTHAACGLLLAVLCLGLFASCNSKKTTPPNTAKNEPVRIVSLSPAITRMVVDMGQQDRLVGVAQHDDASFGLPVCGNYLDPDIEFILSLEPDLILTELGIQPTSARLAELEMAGVFEVVALPTLRSVAGVADALTNPEYGLGVQLDAPEAAERTRQEFLGRLALIAEQVEDWPRPRVLMLLTTDPLGAIGTGVTHDELLTMAGGENVLSSAESGYVLIDRQMLIEDLRPDVILLIEPTGAALSSGDSRLAALEGLPIPAVAEGRVVLIDHPQALLPSTSLPEVLVQMVAALHPDTAEWIRDALTIELPVQRDGAAPGGDSGARRD
ncbi:MAG: ABC transporter substrate-binding protein [Planctomycetota bacterium]